MSLYRHLLLFGILCQINDGISGPPASWAPAHYQGLVMGISTRSDVIKRLGQPKGSGLTEGGGGLPYIYYPVSNPFMGDMNFDFRHNILDGAFLHLAQATSREDIIGKFGASYTVHRYSVDQCSSEGGSAPLYENPRGSIARLEYRERGIAVVLEGDVATDILFVRRPIGSAKSRCKMRRAHQ